MQTPLHKRGFKAGIATEDGGQDIWGTAQQAALAAAGWKSLVVWECALRDEAALTRAVAAFLGPPGRVGARPPG